MALKDIKRGRWGRQLHVAGAGLRAGFGWAGGQLRTLGLPAEERDSARDALLQQQAQTWVRELGQLKGSIVKIGQILATYADYCLPEPVAVALHQLEADTEPLAWPRISSAIYSALAGRQSGLIVEPVPLAAASLAQVHRARRKCDGAHLCLKVLYPGIRETLDSDLDALASSLRWWLPKENRQQFDNWLDVIHAVLTEELDLLLEAQKLQRWKFRLAEDRRYIVPAVDADYSSATLLAMTYEQGVAQHDDSIRGLSLARRNQLAINMLELFLREVLIWGEMQTDPHPGNYRIRLDEAEGDSIVLLDFGSVRKVSNSLLQPLRKMVISAYQQDTGQLLDSILMAGLLDDAAPDQVKRDFVAVLMGLMEPLNYRRRLQQDAESIPSDAVDGDGNYRWAHANLPKRMGKQALASAFSRYFVFPGADFLLLSRKLAGVYAFIAALDAQFDAVPVMEKVLQDMPADLRD